jgi:hypothetical protein
MTPERRHDDKGGTVERVLTLKQMTAVLAFVAVLQTIGGKFVIDSYIDSRVKVHNLDPSAHVGALVAIPSAARDRADLATQLDAVRRDLGEATKAMNDTNQRLARIEGALGRSVHR